MLELILDYFEEIGVDIQYTENEEVIIVKFDIEYEFIKTPVELSIDCNSKELSLSIVISGVAEVDNSLFESINMLNAESIYFKSYYNNIYEQLVISSNLIYNDNIKVILNKLLDCLVNSDSGLIENIYNSLMDEDDLPEFVDIDKFLF